MKAFARCLDCHKPLVYETLVDQWGRTVDELYYINENIFCKECFIQYVSRFGARRGLDKKDIYFTIKEQRFYCDYNNNKEEK